MAGPLDSLIAGGGAGFPPQPPIAPLTLYDHGNSQSAVNAAIPSPVQPIPPTPAAAVARIANPVQPVSGGSGPGGSFANEAERRAYYYQQADAMGVPREWLDRIIPTEGGWATFDAGQDHGTSFGPLAMHRAGTVPGTTAKGLGDEFYAKTGLDPSKPENEAALAQFGIQQLKIHGPDPDIWHGLRRPGMSSLEDRDAAIRKVQSDRYAEAATADKAAANVVKMLNESKGDSLKMWERIRAAQDDVDKANDVAKNAISKEPPQPQINGFKQLNGLAVLVGVLGGLFTKSPMRASVNAAASAIEAYNDHDREAYENSYRSWKTNTDMLFKVSQMTQDRLKDIESNERLSFDERNSMIDLTLRAAGQEQLANQRRTEGDLAYQQWKESTHDAAVKHQEAMVKEENQNKIRLAMLGMPHSDAQLMQNLINQENARRASLGLPPMDGEEQYAYMQAHPIRQASGNAVPPQAQQRADALYQQWLTQPGNAGKTEDEKNAQKWEFTRQAMTEWSAAKRGTEATTSLPPGWDDSTVKFWAGVLKSGGALPPGFARNKSASNAVAAIMKEMGETGDAGKFIENKAVVKADEHSLNNMTKMADAAVSFEHTANRNFDTALRLAPNAVPTELGPLFNKWIEQGDTALGDPSVPAYAAAMITAANEYAKVMSGSTGTAASTVDSRREAVELFSPYLSLPQISAVVAVAKQDMQNREDTLYGQIDLIRNRLAAAGNPKSTEERMHPGSAASPAPASVPVVNNQADYDKLPAGATYKGPDGQQYTKGK